MNQKVQLYIENQLVDTFDSSSINIVASIKDFREPGKLFTDYSQNFNLPATNTNNKIFKHYYDYDVVEGGFDARKSKEARIEINDRPFREGYITLDSVDLKYNKPSTYKVTFYGNLRTLKELFNDLKLSDLDYLDEFNIKYKPTGTDSFYEYLTTSKNIIDSEGTTHTQPIVVPLISNKERLYYNNNSSFYGQLSDGNLYHDSSYPVNSKANGLKFEHIKPSIRVDLIIRAIEKYVNKNNQTYNISFSNDFFNSSLLQYYNLYMWLNKDIEEEISVVKNTQPINTFAIATNYGNVTYGGGATQEQVFSIVCTDSYGNTSGNTGSKFIISGVEDDYADTIEARLRCVSSNTTTKFDVRVYRNGQLLNTFNQNTQTGTQSLDFYVERDGEYRFDLVTDNTDSINFDSGFEIKFITIATSDRNTFNDITYGAGPINIVADTVEFSITENMPDMSVTDFLSGIFKMFNLVCYVEGDINTTYGNYNSNTTNLKNIRVKTLDSYYSSSNSELDITDRIDISSSKVERLLPYSRIEFKYEDTEAILAEQHKSSSELEWGGEFWGVEKSRVEKKYEIIPPFAHMKFERLKNENTDTVTGIQVGYSIKRSNANAEDYKSEKYNPHYGKPLLFYPYRVSSSTYTIPYLYKNPTGYTQLEGGASSYFIPLNQAHPTTATTNHFGQELNEYDAYDTVQANQSNLFNLYYKNYITHLFDSRSRITKVKANLTNAFLSKFSLADKIRISGKTYTINKANIDIVSGKAQFELQRYYSIKSYYCLPDYIDVNIEVTSSGNQYVFDNKYGTYQIGEGIYVFENVPTGHPIAFHNFGKENNITYTGVTNAGSKTGLDGNTYAYYSGDVTVTVSGDFGTISYECYNHGYMGGENNLVYNSSCSEGSAPTPTPVTGTLTVDATDIYVDSALITSDQTDE